MPREKGYLEGRVQSSVLVVNPKPKDRTNVKRKGIRK